MADTSGSGWTITSQREDFRDDGTGSYVDGIKVTFRTGKGQIGSVFVPMRDYVPATVRQLVAAQAARMDQVSDLVG